MRTALKPLTLAVQGGACLASLVATLSCRCEQFGFSFPQEGKTSPSNMKEVVFFPCCLLTHSLLTLGLPVVH